MRSGFLIRAVLLLVANAGLTACATSHGAQDTRNSQSCPSGQILVCKGGDANSRVKDSKLNETDICICRQQDSM
ncbi:MAG: hypothetical protein WBM54_13890 [Woeseia sp.]